MLPLKNRSGSPTRGQPWVRYLRVGDGSIALWNGPRLVKTWVVSQFEFCFIAALFVRSTQFRRLLHVKRGKDVIHLHNATNQARSHSRGNAKRLMHAHPIVPIEVDRQRVAVVLKL